MIYIITGAGGHLGGTLLRKLDASGETMVRGLLLPGEPHIKYPYVNYIYGDVRDIDSLRPLFAETHGEPITLIHAAGLVDISGNIHDRVYDVNVGGTKNIIQLASEYGVQKLIYISSVHAIPEAANLREITEMDHFSPDAVIGSYAKTKAEATQAVLDAGKDGLNVNVVHPSGIIGPYEASGNHMVQMVHDYVYGKLPAGVKGGYDFVDVRDVADGILATAKLGKPGECYILSNRHYEVKDLLKIMKSIHGGRRLPTLPIWIARAVAPLYGWFAKIRKTRPLYTAYSLYTLNSNDRFSHTKATRELGYSPRDLYDTLRDTIAWVEHQRTKPKRPARKVKKAKKAKASV